jgi:hypothetical protein
MPLDVWLFWWFLFHWEMRKNHPGTIHWQSMGSSRLMDGYHVSCSLRLNACWYLLRSILKLHRECLVKIYLHHGLVLKVRRSSGLGHQKEEVDHSVCSCNGTRQRLTSVFSGISHLMNGRKTRCLYLHSINHINSGGDNLLSKRLLPLWLWGKVNHLAIFQ